MLAFGAASAAQLAQTLRLSRNKVWTWAIMLCSAVAAALLFAQKPTPTAASLLRANMMLLLHQHSTGNAPVLSPELPFMLAQYVPLASGAALVLGTFLPASPPIAAFPLSTEAIAAATVILSAATVAGLWLWSWSVGHRHGRMRDFVAQWISPSLIVPIAIGNALTEELEFRVVLQEAIDTFLPPLWCSVLTNIAFALFHVGGGFPNGPVGGALVFLWGSAISLLKYACGGSILPGLLVHVIADCTIFLLIYLHLEQPVSRKRRTTRTVTRSSSTRRVTRSSGTTHK
jgi:membrane protease YdiL (CAAX protease family)